MLNKKLLFSVFILGLAVTLASTGTWAWMSDAKTSPSTTFTSGTLDMQLSDPNEAYADGVTATWSSPLFKPGDKFSAELRFTNAGTVGAKHVYITPGNLQSTPTSKYPNADLSDEIIITNIKGHFIPINWYSANLVTLPGVLLYDGKWVGLGTALGNHDGILTLKEFCKAKFVANYLNLAPVLSPNNKHDLGFVLEGKFDENAGNEYQGTYCTFDLNCKASQDSPTDGCVEVTDQDGSSSPDA
jgi:spore coat-associated protein N